MIGNMTGRVGADANSAGVNVSEYCRDMKRYQQTGASYEKVWHAIEISHADEQHQSLSNVGTAEDSRNGSWKYVTQVRVLVLVET